MSKSKKNGRRPEPPFFLVPDALSDDTIDCLRVLLGEAERGYVLGIAFAAMLKGRVFIVNSTGECTRSRTFTRGMVAELQDHLRKEKQ